MDLKRKLQTLKECDETTYNHSIRCGNYLAMLAEECGKDRVTTQLYREAGYAHDVGKISIMKYVKSKVNIRDLNEEEFKEYKTALTKHVMFADSHLKGMSDWKKEYSDAANYHHCWYNDQSKGYSVETTRNPNAVPPKRTGIPEVAQMLAVVDVYDALTDNTRSYRKVALSDEKVKQIMDENAKNGQFNPSIYRTFMQEIVPKIKKMDNLEKLEVKITSKEKENKLAAFGIDRNGQPGTTTNRFRQSNQQGVSVKMFQ